MNSFDIGVCAEVNARDFLEKNGLWFIENNFVAYNPAGKRCGEIDLIMRDCEHTVFVEVKMRDSSDHGTALEMITPKKQNRIKLAAKYYLTQQGQWDRVLSRFDVVTITPDTENPPHHIITWIKNAFEVQY